MNCQTFSQLPAPTSPMIEYKSAERVAIGAFVVGLIAWYFEINWLLFWADFIGMLYLYFAWPEHKK
jgi:hypothetical protein